MRPVRAAACVLILIAGAGRAATTGAANAPPASAIAPEVAARFAALALRCLHSEYPSHLSHTVDGDADARPPRELHPAFYGCYDWHSAVHGHWLLVRLLRQRPGDPYALAARAELERSLNPAALAGELDYLKRGGRASFERPYGLAWLLRLAGELRAWPDPDAQRWTAALQPLEAEAAARLKRWLPALQYPIRIGEHDQTAFSFGLLWDWAQTAHDAEMSSLLRDAARRFYQADRRCPIEYEPSGEDFLSPCLAEADFMRRVLTPTDYAAWLGRFLPQVAARTGSVWLPPARVTDRSDPKLAHLDGLNLSRAWMLEGIAAGLPAGDPRLPGLRAAARAHADLALPAVTGEHYEGGHWLGTFAVYLVTGAGLD